MLIAIIFLGVLFFLLSFIITEGNASTMLSGYNTMSDEERKNFPLSQYLDFFKKFHQFLGISTLLLGSICYFFISENASGIFLGIYPISAYLYFIVKSKSFVQNQTQKWLKLAIVLILVTLVGVVAIFVTGIKENKLLVSNNQIEITGIYGEIIPFSDIEAISLTDELPKIRYKSNGYAMGDINKGYFKTPDGEKLKLILHSKERPFILIEKKNNQRLFYNSSEVSNTTKIWDLLQQEAIDLIIKE